MDMARIRAIRIDRFRGINQLVWFPRPGLNCLIGPGDSGKSSILDAVDLCLGARRNIEFSDADFYRMDVAAPIEIVVTIGDLDDGLKNLEAYGTYLRGFDVLSETIEDEPERELETVLSLKLTVASDLEPSWSLVSDRAEAQDLTRNFSWADRVRLAPTRIGAIADYHLGWRRGSVLNRVSEERADTSAALAMAAREARAVFGDQAGEQLGETLKIVAETAEELGIPIGDNVKAMLDAHSVSFSGGTISLHDEDGIPLRGLGSGSTRLLIAGLQRRAATRATIILMDELEHGLEPHRIIRLLGSVGAKEKDAPLQVFMTTHSPVALRELSGDQLFVVRPGESKHDIRAVGRADDIQSTIRRFPDAFLAHSVIVCEGASEVGLLRGLDQHRTANGSESIGARGTSLVDCGGGGPDNALKQAAAFQALGYRTAIVRDDDIKPTEPIEEAFKAGGGAVFAWCDGCTLENDLFYSLGDEGVDGLIQRAIELHGDELINEHIKSASQNAKDLATIQNESMTNGISVESREILGKAARSKKAGWFKSVTWMEEVGRDIVGPNLGSADEEFGKLIDAIFNWALDDGQ
jgi:putative ATP-dependent endonuclease of OLD family